MVRAQAVRQAPRRAAGDPAALSGGGGDAPVQAGGELERDEGQAARGAADEAGDDGAGFRFYTGLGSRKATDLRDDPRAALLFAWVPLQRQVSVRGPVEQLGRDEVLAYFISRPYASRIGAWVSEQSAPVADRARRKATARTASTATTAATAARPTQPNAPCGAPSPMRRMG